jgi:apolipoprotein N-acyltransferase
VAGPTRYPAALALLSGLLLAASFPKFGHPAFAWIALAPLIVAIAVAVSDGRGWRSWFLCGVASGVVYFGGALYWAVIVMHDYGHLPLPVAILAGLLMWLYQAIFPGLFAIGLGMAVRKFGVAGVWLAPFFWVAAEWVRSWIGGGFPWALLGSSQASVLPVAQVASVTGVFGLSWLVALVGTASAAIALSRKRVHLWAAIATGVVLFSIATAGALRVAEGSLTRSGEVVRVGLVQGNIDQSIKWNPSQRDWIIRRYIDLSRQVIGAGASLVIWPEASTPYYLNADPVLSAPLRLLAAQARTPFIIGTNESEPGPTLDKPLVFNAAVDLGPDGISRGSYRKMRLVPFGEFVPFRSLLFFVDRLVESIGEFTPGSSPTVLDSDGRRIGVSICYESVYPWISRAFVQRGSRLLATITNDAWFGRSSAVYQHFEQGALRAIEEGRYFVRAANTGISGAVDPYGRTLARTSLFDTTAITVDVRLLDRRTIYSYVGDVVAWLSAAIAAAVMLLAFRRRT